MTPLALPGTAGDEKSTAAPHGRSPQAARSHWPEYLCEALALGAFMASACLFTVLLEYPGSRLHSALPSPAVRRVLMGIAMGATAIAIIYSPLGRRSGAHMNPAVTLTFLRLGRVAPRDALGYVLAQFVGGAAGVVLAASLAPMALVHPSVNYAVTVPGTAGWVVAAVAELVISFALVVVVLTMSHRPRSAPYTGVAAGALVAFYIAIEAPYSGMSMNPARTAASALSAGVWTAWWVYFLVPPIAMLLAAEAYLRTTRRAQVGCAKLHHSKRVRCIFCGFVPDTDGPMERRR
jgi:aquaporin Z